MPSGLYRAGPLSSKRLRLGPARLLLQMLLEEVHGALPGGLGAGFVEAAALVAVEAVLRIGVDENLSIAPALLLDYVDVGHRDRRVLLAEMHHRRHLRLLVGVLGALA